MMTSPNQIVKLQIPDRALKELVDLSRNYEVPGWDFANWPDESFSRPVKARNALHRFLAEIKERIRCNGFAIVCLDALTLEYSDAQAAAASTLLVSNFGRPLRVFLSHPHWCRLGVDLTRPPKRSGGAGQGPLHIDFVNAENPPDLVCLLCIRPDPLGGGKTIIARTKDVERLLDKRQIEILSYVQFRDGEVVNLAGVGGDANPFPVFCFGSRWEYRFTGHLLDSTHDEQALIALKGVQDILESRSRSFTLKRGDLLILDQHQVAHARGAMGHGQEALQEAERRLLLLSYVRDVESVQSTRVESLRKDSE